ncbi:MAG: hypothetical protein M9894_25495 [Planctomycetes bacterium]|nr:hypothetical protein [Planctomycetota bacterium]
MTGEGPAVPGEGDLAAAQARAALFTAAAVLVPLPLVDDLLVRRSRAHLVATLLRAHGRDVDPARLAPLWQGRGCLDRCLGLPFKLLLWPLKKLLRTVFFFLGIRAAALDVGRTLALGRAVDRRLRAGHLAGAGPAPPGADPLALEALRLRTALDAAYAGIDRVAVVTALGAVVRVARTMPGQLLRAARRVLRKDVEDEAAAVAALPAAERQAVAGAVDRLEAALDDPAVQGLLEELDRRFDAALGAA